MNTKNKINKILSLAIVLMALLGTAASAGELIVYEPFDYPAGEISTPLAVNPGTGLYGAWTVVGGDTLPKITGWSVAYGDLPVAGGNWATGSVWSSPEIEATIDANEIDGFLDDGDELWFSFTCSIPFLNQKTDYNQQQLRIGTDENNYIGIYPNKTGASAPGQLQAIIVVDGVEQIGETSVLFEENTHLYVGRVIFGEIDTVEAYLPDTDLALPADPTSTVTGSLDQTTFAKIRSIIYNGNSMSSDEIRIGTTYASIIGYPLSPDVDAGDNMISWSGAEIQLDATVGNNDPAVEQMPLEYAWTHDAPAGYTVSFDPDATDLNAKVTITKDAPTDDVVVITLQLTASNVGGTAPDFAPMKANMTIDLYDTACKAAIGSALDYSDISDIAGDDCITNLADFAELAKTWLVGYELTAPGIKP